jgi:iron-sulfur cluster repair protein YtfE (RIC family)
MTDRHHRNAHELPRIQKRLEVVYATHRERDAATLAPLPGIFFLMKDDLELHMHKEERMLFPAIEESERAAKGGCLPPFPFGSLANPIRVMLAEHESVGASLDQIRGITKNYELPPHACETYRALFKGFEALEHRSSSIWRAVSVKQGRTGNSESSYASYCPHSRELACKKALPKYQAGTGRIRA